MTRGSRSLCKCVELLAAFHASVANGLKRIPTPHDPQPLWESGSEPKKVKFSSVIISLPILHVSCKPKAKQFRQRMESIIFVSAESDFKPVAFCWTMWWVGTVRIREEFVRFDLKLTGRAWRGKGRIPSFQDPLTRNVLQNMPKPPETLEAFARWLFMTNNAAALHDA